MLPGTEMEVSFKILGIILEWTDLVARKEITSRGAQLSMAPLCYTTLHNFTQLGCLCDELSMSEASCIPLWRLPLHQSGVDIKLRAAIATHAVGIAVVVAILSRRTRWHIHQKEIHLAGSDGSDVFSSKMISQTVGHKILLDLLSGSGDWPQQGVPFSGPLICQFWWSRGIPLISLGIPETAGSFQADYPCARLHADPVKQVPIGSVRIGPAFTLPSQTSGICMDLLWQ